MPPSGMNHILRGAAFSAIVLLIPGAIGGGMGHAADHAVEGAPQPDDELDTDQDPSLVLAEVEVKGKRDAVEVDPVRSRTTVTGRELNRRQADNVFTVLQDRKSVV